MAQIKNFPNNYNEEVGAKNVMKWLHGRTSGVFAGGDNAAVTALSTAAMAVQVSDGTGWIANAGQDGTVWWIDSEETSGSKLQVTIDAADGALNRIDRIIVEWKTTTYADLPEVKVLKGTTASNPTAPGLTNNSSLRQISLARVSVAAGTTAITASMITDERLDSSVCGLVTDGISIDTSTMNAQFEALLESIQQELEGLEAGTGVELAKLKFEDTTVETSAFVSDTTYEDYPYRAAVALTGVTSSMIPEVVFPVSALANIDFAPVAECYNGGVYIYATDVPESAITIPTIICWR